MISMKQIAGIALGMLATTALGACATETEDAGSAPDVATNTLDPRDEGSSYNGWAQTQSGTAIAGTFSFTHTLSGSGDYHRGGGGCAVNGTGASCSSDTSCTTSARAAYGSSAFGYCFQGSCYTRPGGPATFCVTDQYRTSGSELSKEGSWSYGAYPAMVGCMTKFGGGAACGGTDGSQYMRSVTALMYME